tara:strand:- start:113 stop:1087 length:975 start_codon:yes stop_codon:yes gene_type:complete
MKDKIRILIFGASGTIGTPLIRRLTKADYVITAVSRNLHAKGHKLKTQGPPGYIVLEECNIYDEEKIRNLVKQNSIVINLIGILAEKGKINTFENVNEKFPSLLSKICKEYGVKQFIHLSSLGIDESSADSYYAKSKLNGESQIRKNFNEATILRPSVVYSVDDEFTCKFMSLLNKIPFVFPIYYRGKTLFRPIHVSDLAEIIFQIILQNIKSKTIECVGIEEISLKNILQRLLMLTGKKKLLLPIPLLIAKVIAGLFEFASKPIFTIDQLRLLKFNNIPSGKFKTNFDIGLPSVKNFDTEVKKYSWMYSDGGQFSQEKYKDTI